MADAGWASAGNGAAPASAQVALRAGRQSCGRLTTYVALGALFGAAGGAAFALSIAPLQRTLYVAANLLLLVLACSIAVRGIRFALLERAGLALFGRLLPLVTRIAPGGGFAGRYVLGLVWGFTPCALVYSVLPVALLAGGPGEGALVMLAFGLGTLPNLVAAGWTLARSQRLFERATYRYAAACVVAGFAVLGLYRAVLVPDALGGGAFCLVR